MIERGRVEQLVSPFKALMQKEWIISITVRKKPGYKENIT